MVTKILLVMTGRARTKKKHHLGGRRRRRGGGGADDDDDDGSVVSHARRRWWWWFFVGGVRVENARGQPKRGGSARCVWCCFFVRARFLRRDREILEKMKSLSLSSRRSQTHRSLLLWNRQRRRDHQRAAGVDELQNPADANRGGIPRDDRTRVDSVRGIAVRLNGFAFDMHEMSGWR